MAIGQSWRNGAMRFSRRTLLFGLGIGPFSIGRRADSQEIPTPIGLPGVKIAQSDKMAGVAGRPYERAADVSQSEGRAFTPYRLLVNASTHQRVGVPFRLSAAVLRVGRADRYRGAVGFRCSDSRAALPATYEFTAADDLHESHLFEVGLQSEGIQQIVLTDEISGTQYSSNAIIVSREEPKYKLYFGDIHIHTQWSLDARGPADQSCIYARDAMNLDFACLTEHDPSDAIWERVKAKAKELYQPGRFATMSAYEWTGHNLGAGHKNVYYRDWEGPLLRSNLFPARAQTTSSQDLWAKLRKAGKTGLNAITIPHHPASKAFPTPWDEQDPEFQRCVEVYSSWGNSEEASGPRPIRLQGGAAPGHYTQDGLASGQRLGFVGGSDSHSGRPGYPAHSVSYFDSDYAHWEPELYTGGFTGVYAEELTREAVFDAIRNRRCYATTGKRIIVDFRIDGHWMGEEFKSRNAPHIFVKAIGTAPLDSVTIVKNNQEYLRMEGHGTELELEFDKTEPPQKTDFYYVRVIQKDFEMAWASPIWISRP
jgi:hypothetical protein